MLPFLMLLFIPLMLLLVVVVVVLVFAPPPAVEVLAVVVVVLVVVMFALPLSVVQPLQKAATASRAKSAMVLRIEFSPVTNGLDCYELCDPLAGESQCI